MNLKGTPGIKQVNRKKSDGKTSRFFGVDWHKQKRKWRAQMRQRINGEMKIVHIGLFESEIAAAWAYRRTAEKYYGQPVRTQDILA